MDVWMDRWTKGQRVCGAFIKFWIFFFLSGIKLHNTKNLRLIICIIGCVCLLVGGGLQYWIHYSYLITVTENNMTVPYTVLTLHSNSRRW